jgi:hypothetical protein
MYLISIQFFSTSYEFMVGSGELQSSATPVCTSDQPLNVVVEGISTKSNFSGNLSEYQSLYPLNFSC